MFMDHAVEGLNKLKVTVFKEKTTYTGLWIGFWLRRLSKGEVLSTVCCPLQL